METRSFNQLKTQLTETDIDNLVSLLGHRCQERTKTRLRSILTYSPSRIPSYGIFERLTADFDGNWSYCAGQSYPDEIRTCREIILGK